MPDNVRPLCEWCERRLARPGKPTCRRCNAIGGVATLYSRPIAPGWAAHLRALQLRAALGLDLFAGGPSPHRPAGRQEAHPGRRRPARA